MNGALAKGLDGRLRGRTDVHLAIAFGSRVRGTESSGSDLDLAVLAPGLDPWSLAAELSIALGVEVDIIDLGGDLPIPLLDTLVREGVVVHVGARGAEARWRTRALLALQTDGPWYRRMRDAWLARVEQRGL